MDENGYVYSQYDNSLNWTYKSFRFIQGDTLHFEYSDNKLAVWNDSNDRYEMEVEKNSGEHYAACAYLCSSEDAVELIHL
jgi:hypothetical protein